MKIYTIGFAQKSAKDFFELLKRNSIECLFDIRLNNVSQLAAFTKAKDLEYFLKEIADIDYIHIPKLAPTDELLKGFKEKQITWAQYEQAFNKLLHARKAEDIFKDKKISNYNKICLLCSEPTPEHCHRRLTAEYLQKKIPGTEIHHL